MNDERMAALEERIAELEARLVEVEVRVGARNRSAAKLKDMTEADAHRALTGDVAGMTHKEAAAMLGVSYAQVYSCRLEYTFKGVHKALRDGGWTNPWSKKPVRK